MPDPVVASISVLTRDHQREIKRSSSKLERFVNQIRELGSVKGIRTRVLVNEAPKSLDRASRVRKALLPTMKEQMEQAFTLSQLYVPVDTGTLKASGKVEGPTAKSRYSLDGAITYGEGGLINPKSGEDVESYAIYVHERTELSHAPPTRAKFVSAAIEETMGDLHRELRDALEAYFATL